MVKHTEKAEGGGSHFAQPPTFANLRHEQEKRTPPASWKNQLAVLNGFMKAHGFSDATPLRPAMAEDFPQLAERFMTEGNFRPSSIPGIKSRLEALRATAAVILQSLIEPEQSFSEALRVAIARSKLSLKQIAALSGCPTPTLVGWRDDLHMPMLGGKSHQATCKKLMGLEKTLDLPPGSLLSRLPIFPPRQKPTFQSLPRDTVAYWLPKIVYRPQEFPHSVQAIIDEFLRHKMGLTAGLRGDGSLFKRDARWRESSSRIFLNLARTFFGFLTLPNSIDGAMALVKSQIPDIPQSIAQEVAENFVGAGLPHSDLHFCHLFDVALVETFITWRTKRAGIENGVIRTYISYVRQLVAKNGFITQYVEAAWSSLGWTRVDPFESEVFREEYERQSRRWAAMCDTKHQQLGEILKNVSKKSKSRDPKIRLKAVLKHPEPLQVIGGIIHNHSRMAPIKVGAYGQRAYAVWFRDHLLLRMLATNPLRNRNFREMKLIPENHNLTNLYKVDGHWFLKFNPSDFKNEKGAAQDAYEVPIPPALTSDIDEYIAVHRVILLNGKSAREFFVTRMGRAFDSPEDLSWCIYRLTNACIDRHDKRLVEMVGFRTHAFRHILATAWLRKNPNDFLTVAQLLHDRIETVLANYVHLQVADGLRRFHSWVGPLIFGSAE